jgi:hypothetical protein
MIRPVPGIASVVSVSTRSGSRPETNVDEQRTLATNPVTTLGTSRARAAVSTSALSAVVVARTRMRRRRVMAGSGMAIDARASHQAEKACGSLAGFENRLAEPGGGLADSENPTKL